MCTYSHIGRPGRINDIKISKIPTSGCKISCLQTFSIQSWTHRLPKNRMPSVDERTKTLGSVCERVSGCLFTASHHHWNYFQLCHRIYSWSLDSSLLQFIFCLTLVVVRWGLVPTTSGSCSCHEHTTNLATGVSRQLVLDCGTIFHPDCGSRDFPSILSDDLWKHISLATEASSDSFDL